LAIAGRIKLVNPPERDLVRGEDGLFRLASGQPAETDANVELISGALESSNVNPAEALVNMVSLARQFEMQMKVLSNAQENHRSADKMLSMNRLTLDRHAPFPAHLPHRPGRPADPAGRDFQQPGQRFHHRLQAGRAVFEDLLYQIIRQPGAQSSQQTQLPSGFQLGVGARVVATERIFTQGSLQQTANSLDVAISGRGFFQVQLPDGSTAYTRDGSFQVDSQGNLVTASGYAVLPNMQIPPDALVVSIAKDGVVSVTQPGNPNTSRNSARSSWPPSSIRPACRARARTCSSRPPPPGSAQVNNPGTQRPGRAQPELHRDLQRQRGRGTGQHDHRPARLRTEFPRHHHLGSDAPASDPDLMTRREGETEEPAMKSTLRVILASPPPLAGCATPPPATAIKEPLAGPSPGRVATSGNGAIFQSGKQPAPAGHGLFEDRRAAMWAIP
jgi:flagellar basal body rod protein FlgG